MVVAREGRLVGEFYGGLADGPLGGLEESAGPGPRPVDASTLFPLGWLTALYTACAAMALVQDGRRALDEPLADLVPELAPEDRAGLTLRRLLTHTSGFPPDLGAEELERLGSTPSLDAIYGEYARIRPIAPPGSQMRYSNINLGLLAQVVERATGEAFGAFLGRRVLDPVGLQNTFLPPPPESWERLARVADTEAPDAANEPFNSAWWRGLGLPYGGAYATAREVARFLTACQSEAPVPGFLAPVTLELMTRVHTAELAGAIPGLVAWARAEWGLGFEVRGDKRLHYFGELTSPETFGQLGLSGTLAWADPASSLVCVVLTNRLLTHDFERRLAGFCRLSNAVAGSLAD